MLHVFRSAVLWSIVALFGALITASPAAAAGLTLTPVTWDVIGLDSNRPATGPNKYPVGAKVCNTSGADITNLQTELEFLSSSTAITALGPTTDTIGNLANTACTYTYFTVQVDPVNSSYFATRAYRITATGSNSTTGETPANRQLFVEKLVSQNRNSTKKISGPGGCNADYTICDPADTSLAVGRTYTYKLYGVTSTAYEQLESFVTFPGSIFRIEEVSATYQQPAGATTDGPWANACGWNSNVGTPNYRSCVGTGGNITGDTKAGGRVVVTYTVYVQSAGTGSLTALFYDFSGSSYHYNADYGDTALDVDFSASTQYPLDLTVVGNGNVTSNTGGITCGRDGAVCTQDYANNTQVTLTVDPNDVTNFTGWTGACAGSGSTCTVTMTAARSVTATFNVLPTYYPLTTDVVGAGSITAASAINCTNGITPAGTDCNQPYASASSVVLTATPAAGYTFTGWSGSACTSTTPGPPATCTITMDAAKNVIATFTPTVVNTSLLDVTVAGPGAVQSDPAGIDACVDTCLKEYNTGQVVTLTATPTNGGVFTGWGGACAGTTSTTCTVTLDQAKSVTAQFQYPLATTIVGSGGVTSAPAGIDCTSGTCTKAYDPNEVITLTATPGAGYVFTGWTGACTGSTTTCTVTLDQARAVTATFAPVLTVQITGTGTIAGGGVSCTANCTGAVPQGTTITLTATPGPGQTFRGWGGACTGTATTCTVTMDQARTVTATFAAAAPRLTLRLTPDRQRIRNGEELTLNVRIGNVGTAAARNAQACVPVPSGFTVVSTGGGTLKDGQICFNAGTLSPDKAKGYKIVLRATTAVRAPKRFNGTATAANAKGVKAKAKSKPVMVRPGSPDTHPVTG